MAEKISGVEAARLYEEKRKEKCGASLEVTIKSTTHSFQCHEPKGHITQHRTPQGSRWLCRE